MVERHEFTSGLSFTVTPGERGPVLSFQSGDVVINEIEFSNTGAELLAGELLKARRPNGHS